MRVPHARACAGQRTQCKVSEFLFAGNRPSAAKHIAFGDWYLGRHKLEKTYGRGSDCFASPCPPSMFT